RDVHPGAGLPRRQLPLRARRFDPDLARERRDLEGGALTEVASSDQSSVPSFVVVTDRKSTRLNSSHDQISYAVFCLKKKNMNYAADNHYTCIPILLRVVIGDTYFGCPRPASSTFRVSKNKYIHIRQ